MPATFATVLATLLLSPLFLFTFLLYACAAGVSWILTLLRKETSR